MPDKITKFVKSLSTKVRAQLKSKLMALKKDPYRMKGVKKMNGWGEDVYRLRTGKIRVIYRVSTDDVEIIDIDYRGNIY